MKKTFNITCITVLVHLSKQHNQSKYVESLVMNDIHNHSEALTKDDVIRLILQYGGSKKPSLPKDDSVLNSVKNLIGI